MFKDGKRKKKERKVTIAKKLKLPQGLFKNSVKTTTTNKKILKSPTQENKIRIFQNKPKSNLQVETKKSDFKVKKR